MNFDLKQFYKFCYELKIETKEEGLKKLGNLLGTQTYVMNEVVQDKHVKSLNCQTPMKVRLEVRPDLD